MTLSLAAKASRQIAVSEVKPVQVAECHGPPVRRRSGQLEETLNMKPAWKGWYATVDKFALDCIHCMCGTEEFQHELGFHSPEGWSIYTCIYLPVKSALRDWQLG